MLTGNARSCSPDGAKRNPGPCIRGTNSGLRFAPSGLRAVASRPAADQVNLDQRVVGKPGDTDAGAGRQAVGRKEPAISLVHCGVVFLETCEINACHHDVFETEIDARQYYLQI